MAYGKLLAFNPGSTWGTAVSCNVASKCGMHFDTFEVDTTAILGDTTGTGRTLPGNPNFGGFECAGSIRLPFHYTVMPRVIWLVADYENDLTGSPEIHRLTQPQYPRGVFGTWAHLQSGVEDYSASGDLYREVNSASADGLQLQGRIGEAIMAQIGSVGDQLVTPAVTNTSLANADPPAQDFVKMEAGDADFFALGEQGGALSNVDITSFTFTHSIPRDPAHGTVSETIGLPGEGDKHGCTLEVELREFDDHQWIEDLAAKNAMEAKFTFPTMSAASATLTITNMRLRQAPATTGGKGRVTHSLTFDCYEDAGQNATNTPVARADAAWELIVNNGDAFDYGTTST